MNAKKETVEGIVHAMFVRRQDNWVPVLRDFLKEYLRPQMSPAEVDAMPIPDHHPIEKRYRENLRTAIATAAAYRFSADTPTMPPAYNSLHAALATVTRDAARMTVDEIRAARHERINALTDPAWRMIATRLFQTFRLIAMREVNLIASKEDENGDIRREQLAKIVALGCTDGEFLRATCSKETYCKEAPSIFKLDMLREAFNDDIGDDSGGERRYDIASACEGGDGVMTPERRERIEEMHVYAMSWGDEFAEKHAKKRAAEIWG